MLFVRRNNAASVAVGAACASMRASAGDTRGPMYAALREATAGMPCFLARASEESLCRTLRCTHASLPTVAVGKVVHVEQLHAPLDEAAAADLGLPPGTAYGMITAEMLDELAPEVQGRWLGA